MSNYYFWFFEPLWQLIMTIVQVNLVTDNISRQFQTSGILLFMDLGTWKLYGPEVSQFLACMLQRWTIYGGFSYFQLQRGNRSLHIGLSEKVRYLTLDLLKSFFLWTIRKKTSIVSLIIGRILDLPRKSSNTREASIIRGAKLNITASILELLKIFFEVTVAFNVFFFFSIFYFPAIVIVYNSCIVQNNILIKIDEVVYS